MVASGLPVAVAQGVLGKLGEIAAEKVLNEASLLLNFKEDFKWLQQKFILLSAALQDADNQSTHTVPVNQWLQNVNDIVLDAEDIIDECAVEHLYTCQMCVGSCSELIFNRKMGKKIKELKDRVSSVIQDGEHLKLFHDMYRLDQPSTSGTSDPRGAQFRRGGVILEEDPRAVGIDEKAKELERLLEHSEVRAVAVVGIGGLGKTFLLQHVFKRSKQRYEHSAWVSVSQNCSVRTMQSDLARQINLQVDSSISDVLVADLIHGHLEGKSCLIVLDDVWDGSVQGNIIQRLGLSSGRNNQCRIVITTRSRQVAANIRAHIYEIQQLSKEDSWTLFCLFAFPTSVENRAPEDLESLALQIVKKCGGIPLALKTVAASMSSSVTPGDWESKLRQLKDVVGAEDQTMEILKLSYKALPSHLKCCFAYFSLFPEDTEISFIRRRDNKYIQHDYLIYLWIAEGFIPQENEKDQCDMATPKHHTLREELSL